ncbi:unnamed protein product [Parascedosporium putredinis]|uniref:Uncharacterized protein n=1 Tax=Parascedosporium putredinis TaxID=1442378 RepID=A0A9P1H9H8_9PEZI|nr:unnamed protein product [Parascedosporium putredinis]CAI8000365.1 unnamed protein product [Parascedosporium putredinis]
MTRHRKYVAPNASQEEREPPRRFHPQWPPPDSRYLKILPQEEEEDTHRPNLSEYNRRLIPEVESDESEKSYHEDAQEPLYTTRNNQASSSRRTRGATNKRAESDRFVSDRDYSQPIPLRGHYDRSNPKQPDGLERDWPSRREVENYSNDSDHGSSVSSMETGPWRGGYAAAQGQTRQPTDFAFDHDIPSRSWLNTPSYQDFRDDEAHEFWKWDPAREAWVHVDKDTGKTIVCPRELD